MAEELQYKTGETGALYKEERFHGTDADISVEEMWKAWQYSEVYNWTTEHITEWVSEQVKLPQYAEYFRRNRIDGQFLPRFAVNDNNYYANVLQIKDLRHKRLIMIKATDLVLFGYNQSNYKLNYGSFFFSLKSDRLFIKISRISQLGQRRAHGGRTDRLNHRLHLPLLKAQAIAGANQADD
jgi:hypothetical protein